jgi:hypothetical protein
MKTYITTAITAFTISLLTTSCYTTQVPAQTSQEAYIEAREINYNTFYNELSPYGRWVDYPGNGRVWVCNEVGFRPYGTNGHWQYTSYGWMWVSDYRWGWSAFHYGRWGFDAGFGGWYWVPGYEWAPAWVNWRGGGSYYGWAPLAPGFSIGVGINNIPMDYWSFVPSHRICENNLHNYYINRTQNNTIINNTTVINNTNIYNNTTYQQGPQRLEVEKNVGRKINAVPVRDVSDVNKVGNNTNELKVYRPTVKQEVNSNNTAGIKNAPAKQPILNDAAAMPEKNIRQPQRNTNADIPAGTGGIKPPPAKLPTVKQAIPERAEEQQATPTRRVQMQPSNTPVPEKNMPRENIPPQRRAIPNAPAKQNHGSAMPRENTAPVRSESGNNERSNGNGGKTNNGGARGGRRG